MGRVSIAILIAMLLCGCRTVRHVPVETVRVDTLRTWAERIDSVRTVDSVLIEAAGDTVRVSRLKYVYKYKLLKDTVYRSRTDTISVPVEVERPLTGWERVKQDWGGGAILCVALIVLGIATWAGWRLKRKS